MQLGAGLGSSLGLLGTTLAQANDQGQGSAAPAQGAAPQTPTEALSGPVEASQPRAGAPAPVAGQAAPTAPQEPATGMPDPMTRTPGGAFPGAENKGFVPSEPAAIPASPEDVASQARVAKAQAAKEYAAAASPDYGITAAPGDVSNMGKAMDSLYQFVTQEVKDGRMSPEEANTIYQNALTNYQSTAGMSGVRNADGIMYSPSFQEHQALMGMAQRYEQHIR